MEGEEGVPLSRRTKGGRGWCVRALERRLPVLRWARRYDVTAGAADAVAGVTLGLTLVPQSIAYAALADLPVHVGLYTSFMGTILYTFLGTVKEVSIGPTSLMALLTLQACRGLGVPYVVLLTFLGGCVVLLMGLLRLGFMVDLISPSVTSGFTSATAVIIVVSQLKGVLGLSFTAESVLDNARQLAARAHLVRPYDCALAAVCCSTLLLMRVSTAPGSVRHVAAEGLPGLSFTAESVLDNARQLAARAHLVRPYDCALAAVCCTTLLLMRKLKDVPVKNERLRKALWLVSIGRNALVVLAAATFAYCTHDPARVPHVLLSGRVEPGLPSFALPPFSAREGNATVSLGGMVQRLGPSVVLLPVVMVIANIAIAKAFTAGGRVDASQEMITLGLCNIAGSLVGAMPACGAFTRSAVAHSSGVRTPAASLYCGIITLLALAFLTEYFYFIPKACLSSVLICAVIFMIDYQILLRLWRRDRRELCVVLATFSVSVAATVELGVLAGAATAAALLLAALAAPHDTLATLKTASGEAVVWRPRRALVFLNAERGAARARAALAPRPVAMATPPLLLDAARLALLDYAATQMLERLSAELSKEGSQLIIYNASGDVLSILQTLSVEQRALRASSAGAALAAVRVPAGAANAATELIPLLPRQTSATDVTEKDKDETLNPV